MIKVREVGNDLVINISGRLDVHFSAEVESELERLMEKYPNANFILNLAEVEYMSSSGLRVLVATMRKLKERGKELKLCQLNQAVMKVFEVVELMDMFDIYDNETDALNSLKS
ncbi:MAG: anti-sigma factor antagonist [Candidatus Hydrogenedentota bacterium]|nr:MAG: anti-sigma factor antagonist [Candidatus Hydrogenedentota bacterium]